eukprot:scaffold874_cov380-Prasinococcus_capsulatus_cf.AAC.19
MQPYETEGRRTLGVHNGEADQGQVVSGGALHKAIEAVHCSQRLRARVRARVLAGRRGAAQSSEHRMAVLEQLLQMWSYVWPPSVHTILLLFIAARVLNTVVRTRRRESVDNDPGAVQSLTSKPEWDHWMEHKGLVLVDFTASWCGPCRRVAPVYAQMSKLVLLAAQCREAQLHHFVSSRVPPARRQREGGALREVAASAGVRAMPTFQLYRDGQPLDRVKGADPSAVRAMLAKHL